MRFEKLGPYRLSKKLGQGGMGAVYEGLDTTTGNGRRGESAVAAIGRPTRAFASAFRPKSNR